jgi:glutathione S-transferase
MLTPPGRKLRDMKLVLCDAGAPKTAGWESYSPFALKVHRALRLARLPYETRRGRIPDFKIYNPLGQIPVLLADGESVYDSTKILQRLVELAPEIMPSDARERAEAWLLEDWADRSLRGFVVGARWADERNWPTVRDAYFGEAPWFVRRLVAPMIRRRVLRGLHGADVTRAGLDALWAEYRRILDTLEARAPERGFWIGDRPSLADVAIFGHLHSLRMEALTPWQAREIKLRPALTDWLDRIEDATQLVRIVPSERAAA